MKLSFPILEDWFCRRHIASMRSDIHSGACCLVSFQIASLPESGRCEGKACIYHAGENLTAVSDGIDTIYMEGITQEQVLSFCLRALESLNAWENALYRQMGLDTSLQELLDMGQAMIGLPMSICNTRGWDYAMAGAGKDTPYISPWQEQILSDTADAPALDRRTYMEKHPETSPVITYSKSHRCNILISNIWVDGKIAGALILYENNRGIGQAQLQLLQIFQDMITRYVSMNKGVLLSRSVLSQYLIDMLEHKSLRKYAPGRMLDFLGWKGDDTYCVLAVSARHRADNDTLEALCDDLDRMALKPQTFLYSDRIICLIHMDSPLDYKRVLTETANRIPEEVYAWGISHSFQNLDFFTQYYTQSCHALSYAIAGQKNHMTTRDIAAEQIRRCCSDNEALQSYVHPDVRTLLDYDEAHHSTLANTLYQYLFYSCNYTDAANALGLHRNTLIYRINQITGLITADLQEPEERKLLLLSFLVNQNKPQQEKPKKG